MTDFNQLAEILRCPQTKEALYFTESSEQIAPFLTKENGVDSVFSGYINQSASHFYPIIEGIICLLPNSSESMHEHVKMVQDFYEGFGWKRGEDGRFHDSSRFIEQKSAVDNYYSETMLRLLKFLKPGGKYLLDVASGPVFQPENKALSANFETRICMDISLKALAEARRNIGPERGLFIQGDISNIPLMDGICDNAMSIHTLYHVPRDLQERAVSELQRVTMPGANVVILYNWAWHSWLMNVALLPIRLIKAVKRIFRYFTVSAKERWLSGGLYFYPHAPAWFSKLGTRLGMEVSFYSLTSIHQDFVKYYVHDGFGGPALLRMVKKLEDKFPRYLGKHGAFGFVVMKKVGL